MIILRKSRYNCGIKNFGIKEPNRFNAIKDSIGYVKSHIKCIEIANSRVNWKIEELLPIGIMIKQIDELLAEKN